MGDDVIRCINLEYVISEFRRIRIYNYNTPWFRRLTMAEELNNFEDPSLSKVNMYLGNTPDPKTRGLGTDGKA